MMGMYSDKHCGSDCEVASILEDIKNEEKSQRKERIEATTCRPRLKNLKKISMIKAEAGRADASPL